MSGSQIGSVIGGFVGSFFGPIGGYIGSAVGGYIGGVIDPTVIKGPSIGDAQIQKSETGTPIPKFYGHCPPVAPTVIDGDPIARKITRTHDVGKGSTTKTKEEAFIATRFFLVGESHGECRIGRLYRNGKLVYSTIAGDELDPDSASFASQFTEYTGGPTQGPDPSLEAIHGVGNTPYYRGRLCFVVRDDDETQTGGATNQYRVEVLASSTADTTDAGYSPLLFGGQNELWADNAPDSRDPRRTDVEYEYGWWPHGGSYGSVTWRDTLESAIDDWRDDTSLAVIDGYEMMGWSCTAYGTGGDGNLPIAPWEDVSGGPDWTQRYTLGLLFSRYIPEEESAQVSIYGPSGPSPQCTAEPVSHWGAAIGSFTNPNVFRNAVVQQASVAPAGADNAWSCYDGASYNTYGLSVFTGFAIACRPKLSCTSSPEADWVALPDSPHAYIDPEGDVHVLNSCTEVSGTFKQLQALSTSDYTLLTKPEGPVLASGDPNYSSSSYWTAQYNAAVLAGTMDSGMVYGAGYPVVVSAACYCSSVTPKYTPGSAIWKDVVADIAGRADSRLPSKLDIDNMTDIVPGFVLGNATLTGTDYVRTMCAFYFVDLPEYDGQLHAIRRGGAVVKTFTEDDLLAVEDEDDNNRPQSFEGWQRVTVQYPDPENKYAVTSQTAARTSPDVTAGSEVNIECPIPFDADTIAQKADILQKIRFMQMEGGFKRVFAAENSKYVSSDPIIFSDRRHIIVKVSNDDSMVRFECIYDRPSAYQSTAVGSRPPAPKTQTPNLKGPTVFMAFNSAPLRAEDTYTTGIYIAARGRLPTWPGAQLYISVDGGVTEVASIQLIRQATMGVLVNDLPTGSHREPLVVDLWGDDVLETKTQAQVDAGANAFAIQTDSVIEIGQFRTATDDSNGDFSLTNLEMGLLGTTEFDHDAGDSFCLLDQNLYFLPIDRSLIGSTLYLRPVTLGTAAANNAVYSLVFNPVEIVEDGGTPG